MKSVDHMRNDTTGFMPVVSQFPLIPVSSHQAGGQARSTGLNTAALFSGAAGE